MSSINRLCSTLLAASLGLIAFTLLIVQPTQAQTQSSQQQKLDQLLQQAVQQTRQSQHQQAIGLWQQVLKLAQQLKDRKTEALAFVGVGFNYNRIGQPQKALE